MASSPDMYSMFNWLGLALLIVWFMPNTQQIMSAYRPALNIVADHKEKWLRWRPTYAWLVAGLSCSIYATLSITKSPNLSISSFDVAMTPKQFLTRFLFGYFLLLAFVGIFNRIVDPAWYYRDIEIEGFNAIKPTFVDFARDVKPALLIRDQPEAIILGNSYSEIGFDPTNPYFTDHGRLKGMNFAFAKASWGEEQCDFEFAISHSNIKRALVGFHPGDLPVSDCAKDYASIGHYNTVDFC